MSISCQICKFAMWFSIVPLSNGINITMQDLFMKHNNLLKDHGKQQGFECAMASQTVVAI